MYVKSILGKGGMVIMLYRVDIISLYFVVNDISSFGRMHDIFFSVCRGHEIDPLMFRSKYSNVFPILKILITK